MPDRNFPNFLQAYMTYSQYSEAPDKFHFWTAVSIIAGALRRKVWIDQRYFQWVPNFYIIFVAPPGIVSKSTTAAIGMDLLRRVEGINFGPEALTWQSLVQDLGESCEAFEVPDGTIMRQSAVTIMASEMGTLIDPSDRKMIDAFVSLWDGRLGEWGKSTKSSGTDKIINPWINMLACTTPAWISGAFPEYMIGGGFTSRCVFVYAETKRRLVAYPKDNIPQDFYDMQELLVEDLQAIGEMVGEYNLTPEATEWGVKWYAKHYANRPVHLDNDRFSGYIARKQTHVHKLAIILSASQSAELIITKEILIQAEAIVTSLESEMPKIFSHIGGSEEGRQANEMIQYVIKVGRVTESELFKSMIKTMNYNQFKLALQGGLAGGLIKLIKVGQIHWVYRPGFDMEDL